MPPEGWTEKIWASFKAHFPDANIDNMGFFEQLVAARTEVAKPKLEAAVKPRLYAPAGRALTLV